MTGKRIDIFWAFIIGGCLSVVAEAIWWIIVATGLPVESWAVTVMLITFGVIGMILTYFNIMQKLVAKGGFGAFLPFMSLPCSIILDYTGARHQGKSIGQSTAIGLKGPAFVFGTGVPVTAVICAITYFIKGKEGMIGQLMNAGQLEATPMSLPLYIKAFLVGGLICAIWQIFFRWNKKSITLNMAMGIYLGAILTALSVMEHIVGFAGRGMVLQIHNTGEGAYRWFSLILLFGDISGFLRFLLMLAVLFIGGTVVFGELYYKKTLKTGPMGGPGAPGAPEGHE